MSKIASLNFQYDYSPVILWQYSDAEKIKKIVNNEQAFLDTAITDFRNEFDDNLFNINTCDANGLELWGKLLQINRPIVNGVYFTDEQYRLLLKAKLYVIVWDSSAYGLTSLLRSLFPDAIFRITDCPPDINGVPQPMVVNIDFANGITAEQEVVLRMGYLDEDSGDYVYTFLPRPAGVKYNISFDSDWATTLGFAETITEDSYTGMTETTNMDDSDTPNEDAGVFYK
ncbi:MAG: DUF2612 domain-containing protein [Bacteroidales bacterium]|nr:DUF2612 domain-containing protein [Bacteroidales bacterium]